jgi:hypothetical protein
MNALYYYIDDSGSSKIKIKVPFKRKRLRYPTNIEYTTTPQPRWGNQNPEIVRRIATTLLPEK